MSAGVFDFVLKYAPLAIASGLFGMLGNSFMAYLRSRDKRYSDDRKYDAQLEEHRDHLMFDVLSAAREELKSARNEAAQLRPLVAHLDHFDEALSHIENLIESHTPEGHAAARKSAQAFLARIKRIRQRDLPRV